MTIVKIFLQHLIVLMLTCCTCRMVWKNRKAILRKKLQFHFPFSSFQWTIDDTWLFGKNLFHRRPLMDRIVPKHEQHIEQNIFECLFTAKFCRNNWKMFWENCFLFYWIFPINFILSVPPISFSFCLYDDWSCTFLSRSRVTNSHLRVSFSVFYFYREEAK